MRKTLFIWLFASLFVGGVMAQGSEKPTPTPTTDPKANVERIRTANCDACGYCHLKVDQPGMSEAEITQPVVPANWAQCRDCIYRGADVKGKEASSNLTLIGVPTPDQGFYYTQIGCVPTDAGGFTSAIVGLLFRIVGGISFLYLIYGSVVLATARGSAERLIYGKRILYASIFGLIFALSAVFIVSLVSSSLGLGVSR